MRTVAAYNVTILLNLSHNFFCWQQLVLSAKFKHVVDPELLSREGSAVGNICICYYLSNIIIEAYSLRKESSSEVRGVRLRVRCHCCAE